MICDAWRRKKAGREMTTDEIFRLQEEAKALGFVAYFAFGGEPLMREDIIEILAHAHAIGLYTGIITNGYYLPDMARDLARVADLTIVSLDDLADNHDRMRGATGIFDRAMQGITELKKNRGRVAINSVISRFNMDAAERMTGFAQNHSLRIAFDPVEPSPGFNDDAILSPDEKSRIFSALAKRKQQGTRILNSEKFFIHQTNPVHYRCAQPRIFLRVGVEGTIQPFWCQKSDHILGNVCKQPLADIITSPAWKEFDTLAKECSLCVNSSTVESSLFYYAGFWASMRYLRFALDYAV
jgi:MoaA/NifB/PqqE/SkfB family radical SAM enzyme